MEQGVLELRDADFWSSPQRTKSKVVRRLSSERFLGLVLDAPRAVVLDGRQDLPLVGYYAATFDESDAVSLDGNAVVVVNTPRGCWAARVFPLRRFDTSLPRATERPPRGKGRSYRMFRVELGERFGHAIPFEPGQGYASVVLGTKRSNRVGFRFTKPPAAFEDPAVAEFLAARRAERGPVELPPPVSPAAGDPLPSYRPRPETPPPPAEAGFAVQVPAQAPAGQPCVVDLSFRLPVPAERTVRENPEDPAWGVGDEQATAVLPISLLATGDDLPGPYLINLQVPVYAPIDDPRLGAEAVTGQVALDLLETDALRARVAQGYSLYVISGEHMAGPHRFELE